MHSLTLLPLVDQACVSAGNFGTGVIVARALDQDAFGVFVLATLTVWLSINFQNGLTLRPLVLLGAGLDDAAFARFLRADLVIQAVYVSVAAVVLATVAELWEPLRPSLVALVVTALLMQLQELCRRVLYTRGATRAAVLNNIVNYDLQVAALAVAALTIGLSLTSALWIMAATSLLAVVLGLWQLRAYLSANGDDVRDVFQRTMQIGKWTVGSLVLTAISWEAYPALLQVFHGLAATAALGVIRQLLGPLHLLTRPFENYYLPRAARALANEGPTGLRRVIWQAALFAAPPYLIYIGALAVAPGFVIGHVYGDRYAPYAEPARLFALVELLVLPVSVLFLEAAVRRLQRFIILVHLWSGLVLCTLGIFLIVQLGLFGVAVTTAVALIGQIAVLALILARAQREPEGRASPARLKLRTSAQKAQDRRG